MRNGGNYESKEPEDPKKDSKHKMFIHLFKGATGLNRFFADDPEEETVTFQRIKPGVRERAQSRSHVQNKPTKKLAMKAVPPFNAG